MRETNGNVTTDYFYDNESKPYKIVVKNNAATYTGYYALNQQGDVIAILDTTGDVAVAYEYNAWGRIINETGAGNIQSMNLQSYNHLKYHGYFHDAETGFYYVSSRYYDPVIGRFINEDALVSTGQEFLGYNMFVYCLNNPVNYNDPKGTLAYPGEIHNEVVHRVAKKYGYKKEQFILYKNGGFGRADLISSKGQVWDVKRDKPKQIEAGKKQVKKYVENTWAKSPDTPLIVGGNKIQSDLFYYKSGLITYKVNYRYAGDGVIAYDYSISEVDYQTLGVTVLIAGAILATSGIAAGAVGTLGGAITCFV